MIVIIICFINMGSTGSNESTTYTTENTYYGHDIQEDANGNFTGNIIITCGINTNNKFILKKTHPDFDKIFNKLKIYDVYKFTYTMNWSKTESYLLNVSKPDINVLVSTVTGILNHESTRCYYKWYVLVLKESNIRIMFEDILLRSKFKIGQKYELKYKKHSMQDYYILIEHKLIENDINLLKNKI